MSFQCDRVDLSGRTVKCNRAPRKVVQRIVSEYDFFDIKPDLNRGIGERRVSTLRLLVGDGVDEPLFVALRSANSKLVIDLFFEERARHR